jgi:hypothetical protein
MNSVCELCKQPEDMLVQHPGLDKMVCIACYQDALEALHDDIRGEE